MADDKTSDTRSLCDTRSLFSRTMRRLLSSRQAVAEERRLVIKEAHIPKEWHQRGQVSRIRAVGIAPWSLTLTRQSLTGDDLPLLGGEVRPLT